MTQSLPTIQTPTVEDQISELRKMGASLKEAVDALNSPDYSGLRFTPGEGGGALAYWDTAGAARHKTTLAREQPYPSLQGGLPPGYKPGIWKTLGEFLRDGYRNFKTAEWQTKHSGVFKAVQGLSDQVGADGGFLVLPEFSGAIFAKVYDNDLFGQLDHYTVAGNGMTFRRTAETSRQSGSRAGGIRGYWVDEGQPITPSKPGLAQVALRLKKLAVVVYLTDELIEDAGPAAEQFVVKAVTQEFNFLLGDAIFNGVGGGQPLGLLKSGALLSIAKESGQAAATLVAANIDKMWMRRFAGSNNYRWYKNQDTDAQLANLNRAVGSAGGELIYNPPGGLSSAPFATLKGQPVVDTEFNATLGGQGDLVLADLGQMVAITKGGINQAASLHVEFLTDQTALRFTLRVDFRPWEDTPVTPYKGTNTQSSFLTLDPR